MLYPGFVYDTVSTMTERRTIYNVIFRIVFDKTFPDTLSQPLIRAVWRLTLGHIFGESLNAAMHNVATGVIRNTVLQKFTYTSDSGYNNIPIQS